MHDSGEEFLRAETFARRLKGNLNIMSRDTGVSLAKLDDWAIGQRAHLAVPELERIPEYLHDKTVKYLGEVDKLQHTPRPAIPMPAIDHEARRAWLDSLPPVPVSPQSFQPHRFPNTYAYHPPMPERVSPKPPVRKPGWA